VEYEFNNRIAAQRSILKVVNGHRNDKEELIGLSSKAIDRWVSTNTLDSNSNIVQLVRELSGKLFFLANKSQEQISPEYKATALEIKNLCLQLEKHCGFELDARVG